MKWVVLGILIMVNIAFASQQKQVIQQNNDQKNNRDLYSSYLYNQGTHYFQLKDYKEAISYFEKLYKIEPENEELKKVLGTSYFQLATETYNKNNNLTQAKDYFLSSLKYYPFLETYQNLALVLIKLKNYTQAEHIAQKGLKLKPNSKELLLTLAECYHQRKAHEKLIETFEKLHKYYSADLEIALNLGMLYRINRQSHKAMELYIKLKTQFPKEKQIYERIAEVQSAGFKYKEARETYQELLKYYSTDTEILFKIAKFYTNESKYEEAKNTYRDILKLKTGELNAYRGIVEIYEKQNDIDGAIEILKEAQLKNPNNLIILKEFGRLYEEKGSVTQAKAIYEQIIAIKKDEPYPYIKLGILFEKEDSSLAITYFEEACNLKIDIPLPYYKLATFHKENKNEALYYIKLAIEKALKHIQEVENELFIKFHGFEGNTGMNFAELIELSKAAKKLDEPQEMLGKSLDLLVELRGENKKLLLSDLEGFLEDYPYSSPLLCEIAKIYQNKENYITALTFWEKAVKNEREKKGPYLNIGRCYEKLGKDNEATNSYKRVIELDKDCHEAYEGLIRIYKKQGNLSELITQWEKITNVIDNPTMIKYLKEVKSE